MIRMRHLIVAVGAAMLAACASAPVHYYTLVPEPDSTQAQSVPPASFQFELLSVGIPAQNDVPQLVVRQNGQAVALLDGERWIAPLADEVRSALSVDLSRRISAVACRWMASRSCASRSTCGASSPPRATTR
jgi:uncharacterized lipoprotein YmbA